MHLFVYLFYLYQALDCIMTQAVRTSIQFNTVGRSFFPAKGEVLDVGFGKEVPSVADPDPGSGAFLTPGSVIGFFRISDPVLIFLRA